MSGPAAGPLIRNLRLLAQAVDYEFRKVAVFRAGFVVRELLRGVTRPAVMIFVYLAIYARQGTEEIRGYTFPEMVHYMILVATFDKLIYHNRVLRIGDLIFEGYITKFLVMPLHYFLLALGSWVQYVALQCGFAAALWIAGALVFPGHWPMPAGVLPALEALVLVVLGSYCFFLLYFIVNSLAFWLEVVWTLLVMSAFITGFLAGVHMPVAWMPEPVRAALVWLFPYWTLSAPIEVFLGRLATGDFLRGVGVLVASIAVLEWTRQQVWRRGLRRYSGSGM